MMIPLLFLFLAFCAGSLAADSNFPVPALAPALPPRASTRGPATNTPIVIRSDGGMELSATNGVAVYTKNVRVIESQIELGCERLTVNKLTPGGDTLSDILAETNVLILVKDPENIRIVRGAKAVYTVTNDTVEITGNPSLRSYPITNRADTIPFDLYFKNPLMERLRTAADETNVFAEHWSMETTTDGSFFFVRQPAKFWATGRPTTRYFAPPSKLAPTNTAPAAQVPGNAIPIGVTRPQSLKTNIMSSNLLRTNLTDTGLGRTHLLNPGLMLTNSASTNAWIDFLISSNRAVLNRISASPLKTNPPSLEPVKTDLIKISTGLTHMGLTNTPLSQPESTKRLPSKTRGFTSPKER